MDDVNTRSLPNSVGAISLIRNAGITIVRDRCDFGGPQTRVPLTRVADSLT